MSSRLRNLLSGCLHFQKQEYSFLFILPRKCIIFDNPWPIVRTPMTAIQGVEVVSWRVQSMTTKKDTHPLSFLPGELKTQLRYHISWELYLLSPVSLGWALWQLEIALTIGHCKYFITYLSSYLAFELSKKNHLIYFLIPSTLGNKKNINKYLLISR